MKSHSQMRPRRRALMEQAQTVLDDPNATPGQKARAERGRMILQQLEQSKQQPGNKLSPQESNPSPSDNA